MNRVTQYALDVVEGREIAGRYVRLACKRHLDDLESSEKVPYLYRFDEDKANEIIDFAELLILAEGEKPQQLILEPFQAFILGSLNGWVRKDNGYRRFRSSYIQLARQNGKSLLNGILAAYYGNFSGYNFGQIYCTATKKEQAKIVFNEVVKFIEADEELAELFKVMDYKSTIECLSTKTLIKALSQDTKRMIIDLAEAKGYLRVDYDKDNDLIQTQIDAAEEYIKNAIGIEFDDTNKLAKLLCMYLVKDMYDNRAITVSGSKKLNETVGGIILQLKYCYLETTE